MSTIDEIKESLSLLTIAADHVTDLHPSGNHFLLGVCPFHGQNRPKKKRKFWINTMSQTCGCFVPGCPAYCNRAEDASTRPLDVINFYAMLHNIPLRRAIAELAQKAGLV